MKSESRKLDMKSLLLGAALGAGIMCLAGAATSQTNRKTWEYKVVQGLVAGQTVTLDREINRHVDDGWEFVSASPAHSSQPDGFAVMRREKK